MIDENFTRGGATAVFKCEKNVVEEVKTRFEDYLLTIYSTTTQIGCRLTGVVALREGSAFIDDNRAISFLGEVSGFHMSCFKLVSNSKN